jgi:hypothetical protein
MNPISGILNETFRMTVSYKADSEVCAINSPEITVPPVSPSGPDPETGAREMGNSEKINRAVNMFSLFA